MSQLYKAFANGKWWYSDDEAYTLHKYNGVLHLCEDENFYNDKSVNLEIIGVAVLCHES